VRCRHTGLEGRLSPRPSRLPGSLLRAVARWADVFQVFPLSTAKCRRLGGRRLFRNTACSRSRYRRRTRPLPACKACHCSKWILNSPRIHL